MSEKYETLKHVPGFPGYYASCRGHIVGPKGRALKTWPTHADWRIASDVVSPYVNGKKVVVTVHKMVALAFLGEPPTPEHEIHHLDHNHNNNAPANLLWIDPVSHRQLHLLERNARRRDEAEQKEA